MLGLITVLVDSLIPRIKEIFELSYFQAGLVQFAFFIAYGLISIPAGYLLHRIGYKKGIIVGVAIMGLACLIFSPAASMRSFGLFLLAYFVLASGMTVLQVAINPYVTVLGEPEKASSRLNLAQAFNSLGTTIAPALGAIFILSDHIQSKEAIQVLSEQEQLTYFATEAEAVQGPFFILAISLILIALITLMIKLPVLIGKETKSNYSLALKNATLKYGALGIFVYVGSEVAIGSYLVNYFLEMNLADSIRNSELTTTIAQSLLGNDLSSVDNKGVVGVFVAFYWGGAMLGRFIGAYLTKEFQARKVLMIFAIAAFSCLFISMHTFGFVSMISILAVGLFNSIMFPTIFSLSIANLGDLKPEGSGVLCTAIAGGAFIPPLYGFLTDHFGFKLALFLMIACYAYITFFAWKKAQ